LAVPGVSDAANIDTHPGQAWETVRLAAREACYDWYLAALLAPRSARADLIALAAFAGEVGRIPSLVNEPMIGAIRLHWWRDALGLPAGALTGHPVADMVRAWVARHPGSEGDMIALIDAHDQELQADPPVDLNALADNFDRHWGSLIRLSSRVLDDDRVGLPTEATRDGAASYGLARLACELSVGLRRDHSLVPLDILVRSECSPEDLATHRDGASARKVHAELVVAATEALVACRRRRAAMPPRLAQALRPLALVPLYLKMAQAGSHPPSELAKTWRMLCAWATSRF
jgi:phytoene synthase